jgi:hypothetical protein
MNNDNMGVRRAVSPRASLVLQKLFGFYSTIAGAMLISSGGFGISDLFDGTFNEPCLVTGLLGIFMLPIGYWLFHGSWLDRRKTIVLISFLFLCGMFFGFIPDEFGFREILEPQFNQ